MIIPNSAQKYIDLQRTGFKNNPDKFVLHMEDEIREINPYLPGECNSVLDIGCGLSVLDVLLQQLYKKKIKLFLADKDTIDENIHYGYKATGSFYNSFSVTEELLKANGVENYTFIPAGTGSDIPFIGNQNIIISLLSCGYHYPVDLYLDKMNELLSANGVVILDIREQTYKVVCKEIKKVFPVIEVIRHQNKAYRICARRPPIKKASMGNKKTIGDKKLKREIPYSTHMRWEAVLKRIPENIKRIGAEIGVLTGDTAVRILTERPLVTHIMIDPWVKQPRESSFAKSGDTCSQTPAKYHAATFEITKDRTKFAGERAVIKRKYSVEAVKEIEDNSLDYVFIDADHSLEGCKQDLKLWFPKIKRGGWIGGHDYGNQRTPGVKKAVDEFFSGMEIELDHENTWFVRVE